MKDHPLRGTEFTSGHLRFYPNEPPTIADKKIGDTYLLEPLVATVDLKWPTSSVYDKLLLLSHKLTFGLTGHYVIIPKMRKPAVSTKRRASLRELIAELRA